jgi:hypothetical protein
VDLIGRFVSNAVSPPPPVTAVCGEALEGVAAGLSGRLAAWLQGLHKGVEEDLLAAFLRGDLVKGIRLLPALFPRAGTNQLLDPPPPPKKREIPTGVEFQDLIRG